MSKKQAFFGNKNKKSLQFYFENCKQKGKINQYMKLFLFYPIIGNGAAPF